MGCGGSIGKVGRQIGGGGIRGNTAGGGGARVRGGGGERSVGGGCVGCGGCASEVGGQVRRGKGKGESIKFAAPAVSPLHAGGRAGQALAM